MFFVVVSSARGCLLLIGNIITQEQHRYSYAGAVPFSHIRPHIEKCAIRLLLIRNCRINSLKKSTLLGLITKFICDTFVKDKLNCGQVRGPVQLGFARSIDPIVRQEVSITRVAITTEADFLKKETEMGRKHIVPYALYRADGFISANLARRVTGFNEDDLELLWNAIVNMFENDHSAARGKMAVQQLIIFRHDTELGNAPSHKTLGLVSVQRKDGVDVARSFADYEVTIDRDAIPDGVAVSVRS